MNLNQKDITAIRQLANQLLDIVDRLSGDRIEVSPEIAAMVADKTSRRVCLSCGKAVPEGENYKKGNDESCYGTLRARIRRGQSREIDLIREGKMTNETQTPGRKAKMDIASEALQEVLSAERKVSRKKKP
jgi:predicted nucleic acid-binding Zn ribbon protein